VTGGAKGCGIAGIASPVRGCGQSSQDFGVESSSKLATNSWLAFAMSLLREPAGARAAPQSEGFLPGELLIKDSNEFRIRAIHVDDNSAGWGRIRKFLQGRKAFSGGRASEKCR